MRAQFSFVGEESHIKFKGFRDVANRGKRNKLCELCVLSVRKITQKISDSLIFVACYTFRACVISLSNSVLQSLSLPTNQLLCLRSAFLESGTWESFI